MMNSTNVMASVQAAIVRERLRQATCNFNVALCGMAVCTLVGTIGVSAPLSHRFVSGWTFQPSLHL